MPGRARTLARASTTDGCATAIVLARRGSKGLPGKNTALVGGRPCVAWSIDAAVASRTVGRVAVSSDDPDVLGVARAMGRGIELVGRPRALAGDRATVDAAARHAAGELGLTDPRAPVVILYGNVPVRPADLIDRAVGLLVRTGADSVQSYAPVGKFHPWWIARVDDEAGRVRPWQGRVLNHGVFRRQDLPPAFIPDGGVLVVTLSALMLKVAGVAPGPHAFFGKDRRGVINPEGSVVDIDSAADMLVAEAVMQTAGDAPERRASRGRGRAGGARAAGGLEGARA
jgi:N-acylneuraminate cytidylyltransferase